MTTPAGHARALTMRKLTRDDHATIQQKCGIDGERGEDYSAVFQKGKGFGQWSIHVFARQPTQNEIDTYEQTASRLKFKGPKAQIEGSQIKAASALYNALVARAFDVLVGLKSHERMNAEQARAVVPALVKREAVRQLIAEVYSESRVAEALGEDDEDEAADDNPEAHTAAERGDSEP